MCSEAGSMNLSLSINLSNQNMRAQAESVCRSSIEIITIKRVTTLSREASDAGLLYELVSLMPSIRGINL